MAIMGSKDAWIGAFAALLGAVIGSGITVYFALQIERGNEERQLLVAATTQAGQKLERSVCNARFWRDMGMLSRGIVDKYETGIKNMFHNEPSKFDCTQ